MPSQTGLYLLTVFASVTSVAFVISATILLWHNRKGWGWFLFGAILVALTAANGIR